MAAAVKGYKCVIVISEKMSQEKVGKNESFWSTSCAWLGLSVEFLSFPKRRLTCSFCIVSAAIRVKSENESTNPGLLTQVSVLVFFFANP